MADKGHTDKIKGKTKEVLGDLRGDNKQKAEGILDQAIGKTKEITSATRPNSMTQAIPITVNAVYASCQFYWRSSSANSFETYTRDVYLNFPDMQQYDNGHVLKIKRGVNSGNHLYLSPGSYTYKEYVSGSLVERTGPTAIMCNGADYKLRTDLLDIASEGDAMEFVFFGDLSTTISGMTYRGIWVQWKNPREW